MHVKECIFTPWHLLLGIRPVLGPCVNFFLDSSRNVSLQTNQSFRDRVMDTKQKQQNRSTLFTGILIGIGIIGFLDETIFHQILQWHTFYWQTDSFGRILSDGLFHVFSTLLLLWGTFRIWRGRANGTLSSQNILIAGILIGAGGFNFYDGIIQHAILHLHLVNELVCATSASRADTILGVCRNDVPYEVAWDLIGFVILAIGFVLWRRETRITQLD